MRCSCAGWKLALKEISLGESPTLSISSRSATAICQKDALAVSKPDNPPQEKKI